MLLAVGIAGAAALYALAAMAIGRALGRLSEAYRVPLDSEAEVSPSHSGAMQHER